MLAVGGNEIRMKPGMAVTAECIPVNEELLSFSGAVAASWAREVEESVMGFAAER